jgi:hypothetical protein
MSSWCSAAVWTMGLVAFLPGCKKSGETSALAQADQADEIEDQPDKGIFDSCTERAEMKAGNHYKVYDCGAQRASYYDSPGKMTFDEVTAPISAEARSLGYQVFPSDGTMHIQTPVAAATAVGAGSGSGASAAAALDVTLPVKFLTHKTPPALGAETKFTVVVILQPLEGERTRVHDCRIPASSDPAVYEAGVAWCNQAFDEIFSYEKSAEESLLEMKKAEVQALEDVDKPVDPKKPTTVIIGDQK